MIYIKEGPILPIELQIFSQKQDIAIVDLEIKQDPVKLMSQINDTILMIDPDLSRLSKVLDFLDKKIVTLLTYVNFEILELLANDKIQCTYIFDDLDEILLTQHSIKYEKIYPSIKLETTKKLQGGFYCIDPLSSLNKEKISTLVKLAENNRVVYAGLKELDTNYAFKKMLHLNYSKIDIVPYPIFETLKAMTRFKYLITFQYENKFSTEAFIAAKNNIIPFLNSNNRMYKWLPGNLHFNTLDDINLTLKNNSSEDLLSNIKKLVELHEKNFCV